MTALCVPVSSRSPCQPPVDSLPGFSKKSAQVESSYLTSFQRGGVSGCPLVFWVYNISTVFTAMQHKPTFVPYETVCVCVHVLQPLKPYKSQYIKWCTPLFHISSPGLDDADTNVWDFDSHSFNCVKRLHWSWIWCTLCSHYNSESICYQLCF